MIRRLTLPIALACALAVSLSGCGSDPISADDWYVQADAACTTALGELQAGSRDADQIEATMLEAIAALPPASGDERLAVQTIQAVARATRAAGMQVVALAPSQAAVDNAVRRAAAEMAVRAGGTSRALPALTPAGKEVLPAMRVYVAELTALKASIRPHRETMPACATLLA